MKEFSSLGLRLKNGELFVLDQTLLPREEVWVNCKTIDQMVSLIHKLSVRGAPLIGVAAAASLALYAKSGASQNDIKIAAAKLRAARPTAVNLMWAMDQMNGSVSELAAIADSIVNREREMCERMAEFGASLVGDGENILTHCNTGGLATTGIGTALGVIRKAWEQGKKIHVYVDETRPLLQGARLTAWELKNLKIPFTLICDNMAGALMQAGKIQRAFVGADRIAVNGDFANKIGTYTVAVLCAHHKIPFHVVAPESTFDPNCKNAFDIPIEQRASEEVTRNWSPEGIQVFNPSFDVTPGKLVTSFVSNTGIQVIS